MKVKRSFSVESTVFWSLTNFDLAIFYWFIGICLFCIAVLHKCTILFSWDYNFYLDLTFLIPIFSYHLSVQNAFFPKVLLVLLRISSL